MRLTKIRLAKLASMVRNQVVLSDKKGELRQRMQSAQARGDERIREKLAPEDFDQYLVERDDYYTALYQRWAELRSTMPCRTLADKFEIADRAAELAIEQTGFNRPIV
ncbi:hypothetical protein A3197_09810 [Candidatus Thiodiazotropha endoloripes]|nr:hypothetical protein A3197_09810 [Candidatus Thiodiazotropha endoloripes]